MALPSEGSPCPECNVGKMRDGNLIGWSRIRWLPSLRSMWKTEYRPLDAWACGNCGHVAFRVRVR